MTNEQISLLKESYMKQAKKPNGKNGTLGEYMRFCLDGSVDFTTSKDMVVFDDDNGLLHCVCINDNQPSQADFPVKVISSEYAMVQQVESIMSKDNFKKLISSGFLSPITSDERKQFMIKWLETFNNQALQPMDSEPAYEDNTKVIPMPASKIEREEINYNGVMVGEKNYGSLQEAIDDNTGQSVDIKLLSNTTGGSIVVPANTLCNINLNENDYIANPGEPALVVTGGSTVFIENGKIIATDADNVVSASGNLYISNTEIEGSGCNEVIHVENGITTLAGNTSVSSGSINNTAINVLYSRQESVAKSKARTAKAISSDGAFLTIASKNVLIEGVTRMGKDPSITENVSDKYGITIPRGYVLNLAPNLSYGPKTADTVSIIESDCIASVGDMEFPDLSSAFVAASNTGQDVLLLKDHVSTSGIVVPSGSDIRFDLCGHTLSMISPGVGSTGTETNGFQLLKDSDIIFTNGTITALDEGIKILIQNYSNLTLDHIKLDGSQYTQYVLSNNYGSICMHNTTINALDGTVALDVYYGMSEVYDDGVLVSILSNSTINGKITMSEASRIVGNCTDKYGIYYDNSCSLTNISDDGDLNSIQISSALNRLVYSNKVAYCELKLYSDLAEAVADNTDSDQATINIFKDISSSGIIVPENANITFDLGGCNLTMEGPMVGSTGTENNGFQLLKDGSIRFANGTITAGENTKILIQNYSNLTLNNIKLVGLENTQYVLSNNYGFTRIVDSEIVATDGNVAFDAYYGMSPDYYDGVAVFVQGDSIIIGAIEYGCSSKITNNMTDKYIIGIESGIDVNLADGLKLVPYSENNDELMRVVYEDVLFENNDKYYSSLQALLDTSESLEHDIRLIEDATIHGVKVAEDTNFDLDLNTHTLTISDPLVGSTGTETNGFQLLKNNVVYIRNGKIVAGENVKMLIQNYADLTLDNVDLEGSIDTQYVVSNNFGNSVYKNNTSITAVGNNVAFDLYYGMSEVYDDGVSVLIEDDTVTINGKVELGKANRVDWDIADKRILTAPEGYELNIVEV